MKKILAPAMVFVMLFACSKKEPEKTAYVAKVNSAAITEEDVKNEMKGLPDFAMKMFEGENGMHKFVDELVKKEILFQEAKKKGLDKDPEYLKKVEEFRKINLVRTLLEKEIEDKAKVSDKEIKEYYEKNKEDFTSSSQVKASHILVKSEEEAKKIYAKIKKGSDFAKTAKENSIDPGSAKNGGDIGFFSKGQMVPEFEGAAFNLKTGEISQPVKSQFGYHIIKVTDRKEGKPIDFEKVKDLLGERLTAEKQKQVFDSYVENLKKTYNVDLNKENIKKLSAMAKASEKAQAQPQGLKNEVEETRKP